MPAARGRLETTGQPCALHREPRRVPTSRRRHGNVASALSPRDGIVSTTLSREEFENELRGVLDRLSREPGDHTAYDVVALRLVEAAFMTAYSDIDGALAALYTLRAALRNVAEIDVHSRRGRRRRQRFSQQLITLPASVLEAASGIRA
jgi:hypothetical protein